MNLIAITIDYETWSPIPNGKRIEWEKDIFLPLEELIKIFESEDVKCTVMAEMGEYFWTKKYAPQIAERMEQQWKNVLLAGHDIQLHLHPNWLPELGAKHLEGRWIWDWSKAKCEAYPGDLTDLINKCKKSLESLLSGAYPKYYVTSFRSGAYQVQPFRRLYWALKENGIFCDSSVYAGGYSIERGYDFRLSYSAHQPYFANQYDPQLKAPPSEQAVIEIPIFTFEPNQRWFIDGSEGGIFAERLMTYLKKQGAQHSSDKSNLGTKCLHLIVNNTYKGLKPFHRYINKFVPKWVAYSARDYEPETNFKNNYFIMIGHTKGEHDFVGIARNLQFLKKDKSFKFLTLSQMVNEAKQDIMEGLQFNESKRDKCKFSLDNKKIDTVLQYLKKMMPLDKKVILDLGCGVEYYRKNAKSFPWMDAIVIADGLEIISKKGETLSKTKFSLLRGDIATLPFSDKSFDCVCINNTLERISEVDKVLYEIYRILNWRGTLLATIRSDARNPKKICDCHVWKTAPHEVKMRLDHAGFVNIEIKEIDTFRTFGLPPYPPSRDQMIFVKAWKRKKEASREERAIEMMDWVYRNLSPDKSQESNDPVEILSRGYAFCWGYAVVLGKLLEREGFDVNWVTMLAKGHPKGRGKDKVDSHEVVTVQIDGTEKILDPMANTVIPYPLADVLSNPELAVEKKEQDSRYKERGYCFYDTSYWYSRVFRYAVRSKTNEWFVHWRKNRAKV